MSTAIVCPVTPATDVMPEHAIALVVRGYRDAYDVQNACNIYGVANTLADRRECVSCDLSWVGSPIPQSTNTARQHPIFVLFASKLHDMTGLGISDSDRFGLAYHLAERVKAGEIVPGTDDYRMALATYYAAFNAPSAY